MLKENSNFHCIGRYQLNDDCYDVVYNEDVNDEWSPSEKYEYLKEENGYHNMWTYNINSILLKNNVMKWINELPEDKRNKRNVIRHIMFHLSNSEDPLIIGKWDDDYTDGKPPSHWINTDDIFYEKTKTKKPVKYGQCWCYAECMTSICRFLGIPCRTIHGKNVLIDANLDNGIDFKEELRKSGNNGLLLLNKKDLTDNLMNVANGTYNKCDKLSEDLKIFDVADSYWNIHYWNEVWIDNEWWIIDSTPNLKTTYTDDYEGEKMLGPTKINSFKDLTINDNYDFKPLFSMINAPYRLWADETIIENDELISISYVYSIIYPNNKEISVFINNKRIKSLFNDKQQITTRLNNKNKIDITSRYRCPSKLLKKMYFQDGYFEGEFYIQCVYLDFVGNVIKVERYIKTVDDMKEFYVDPITIPNCYIISYLLINSEKKWFTFLKYC